MRSWILAVVLLSGVAGCVSAPPPPPHVVEREVVDQNGNVIERDHYYAEEAPPAAQVEVIPVAPYYGAVWVRGYWVRYRHHWEWVPGHWRRY